MARNKKDPGKLLSSAVMLFYFSAFLLIACKDYAWQGFALALAVPAMIWIGTNLLPRLFPSDRLLLSLTNFLCALGVLVLYSTEPEYAYNQAMYYGVGIAAMIVCVWIVRLIRSWRVPVLLLMPVSLVLLTLPLLIGRETNGATNWFYVGNLSVQPSEIVKLSLLLIISYYMSRHRMLPWLCRMLPGAVDAAKGPGHGADVLWNHPAALLRLFQQSAAYGCGAGRGRWRSGAGLSDVCACEKAGGHLAESMERL